MSSTPHAPNHPTTVSRSPHRPALAATSCLAAALAATGSAQAQPTRPAPPGLHSEQQLPSGGADGNALPEWQDGNDRGAEAEPSELQLINYFFARTSLTNQLGDPSGLRGVSLGPIGVGEAIGSGTSVGDSTTNWFIEQRWIPVISYSPLFVDGLATFRAQFEVDFTWGLAANTVQNNQGGGFNADQVNLQTKNVNVAIHPTKRPRKLSIVLGTQSLYDSPYDPAVTSLFDVVQTGYKLTFFGTDATGIAAYLNDRWGVAKASFIPIGSAQPDKAVSGDARFSRIFLATLDYGFPISPGTVIGASYWHLQDDTKGAAYAYEGLVPSGPASVGLAAYTGTAPFDIEEPNGHVEYVGVNYHHNIGFKKGRFASSGFAMANFGNFASQKLDTLKEPTVDIRGLTANVEGQYMYGQTQGDRVTLEGMFSTGDDDVNDGTYTGAFTMNYYGLPGAVWFNHKTLLMFPFTSTVSNYTGAVTDISNRGAGLFTAIATAAHDIVPNKLNLKLGAAYGQSVERQMPIGTVRPGRIVGFEANVELTYTIKYLMNVGLHGGYLFRGSFYDGNSQVTDNPWATFLTYTWYAF